MKLYKLMFFSSLIIGTLIAISSYSWFMMWIGLEINLLSIIPLISNKKNILSSESSLKYFLTQTLASLILLMTVVLMLLTNEFINPLMNFYFNMMLNTALLTKLGAAPFHFWLPEVIEGLTWPNTLIMLTWQKIAPMMLIMSTKIIIPFLLMSICMSMLISVILGFNQVSLRKILAFSSINHIAWMLSTMLMSFSMWFIYFITYSLINLNIISMFNITKTYFVNQINNSMNQNKLTKFTLMLNFLSLGGLPPFIGFLPKWMIINWLTNNEFMFLTFLLIVSTLIMLFIYTRLILSSMVFSSNMTKSKPIKMKSLILTILNSITLISLVSCTLMFNFF